MESRYVRPLSPIAAYIGGKRHLAPLIIEKIERIRHTTYVEPFVGMGGIFLKRGIAPQAEVMNDWSGDVATLFRVLQRHCQAFIELMRFQLTARAEFERLVATPPETLTDLERAARFLYLQRLAFGGKVTGRNFGVDPLSPATFNIHRLEPLLGAIHERLAGVVIERLPYAELIKRYDRPGTLFYLDPPYYGSERDYGRDLFGPGDFPKLVTALKGIEGRFLLSINDTIDTRLLFRDFAIEPVTTTYTIGRFESATAAELLVSGGKAPLEESGQQALGF